MDILTILAVNLRSCRKRLDMTQGQFALLCGISTKTLSLLENGLANPSVGLLEKICLATGLSMADLLAEPDSL